jgi:hypothetical protein
VKNRKKNISVLMSLSLVLASCITVSQQPLETLTSSPTNTMEPPTQATQSPTPVVSAASPTPELPPSPVPEPTATSIPTDETTPTEAGQPDEAILILQPGPGSRVISPLRISGEADPTFEQNLVIRIVTPDGDELAIQPTIIAADLGERGPFSAEIPFNVSEDTQAFVQVFSASARDGGVTHLASTGVILSPFGPEDIRSVEPHPERIMIFSPVQGQVVQGGRVTVEGFALASFEQHLLVEVLDEDGDVLAFEPVTVQAPDVGFPGTFAVELHFQVESRSPGRIVVRDPSVAFEGDVHLSSVEVTLVP